MFLPGGTPGQTLRRISNNLVPNEVSSFSLIASLLTYFTKTFTLVGFVIVFAI
jgi:hypothetical protein